MNGELALLVALTSHGNVFLARREDSPPPELDTHPAFTFVRSVVFLSPDGRTQANGPAAWFLGLHSRGAWRLWLVHLRDGGPLPPAVAESFSGGVPRGIQVDYKDRLELWTARWKFGHHQRWEVVCTGVPLSGPLADTPPPLERYAESLRGGIEDAIEFATETGLHHWAEVFAHALERLRPRPGECPCGYLPELGYSRDAHRLLDAADRAWVFGGMGSWNDLWFAEEQLQERYEVVTASLHEAVGDAIIAATNSFDASRVPQTTAKEG